MDQAARVFQWLSLAQFLPSFPVGLSLDCMGLCVLSFTPGQEVFGSSVASCPEYYQESFSDGQPTLPLSAASLCGVRRKEWKIRTGGSVVKKADKHHMSEIELQISLFTQVNTHSTRWEQGQASTLAITREMASYGYVNKIGAHPAMAKVSLNATYFCCLAGGQAERSQKALM